MTNLIYNLLSDQLFDGFVVVISFLDSLIDPFLKPLIRGVSHDGYGAPSCNQRNLVMKAATFHKLLSRTGVSILPRRIFGGRESDEKGRDGLIDGFVQLQVVEILKILRKMNWKIRWKQTCGSFQLLSQNRCSQKPRRFALSTPNLL